MCALGQIQVTRAQGVLDRQGESCLPGIAIDLTCLILEGASQLAGNKTRWYRWWQTFQRSSIQLPDDVNRLEQTVIALLGGKGQVKKCGEVFAETGVTGQEDISIAAFFEPLKRAEML